MSAIVRVRRAPPPPLVVVRHPLLGDKVLVSSRGEPGRWHVIDADGRCDWRAASFGQVCSHVRAMAVGRA